MMTEEDLKKKQEEIPPLAYGEFSINGIAFPIPPQAIAISEEIKNFKFETLRTRESTKARSGHSTILISVTAIFTASLKDAEANPWFDTDESAINGTPFGASVNDSLMPILYSLKRMPLCFIENELVRSSLPVCIDGYTEGGAPFGEPIACFLRSANVSTTPGQPETLTVEFQFVWFNHRPFSPRIKFRKEWWTEPCDLFAAAYGSNGPISDNARVQFINDYGHPSIVFNATAANNTTNDIRECRPFRGWMWPERFPEDVSNQGDYLDRLQNNAPPFVLKSWDNDFLLEFIIPTAPDTINTPSGPRSVLDLVRENYQVEVPSVQFAPSFLNPEQTLPGPSTFMSPIAGKNRLGAPFGQIRKPRPTEIAKGLDSRTHWGIDIMCPEGTPVYAAEAGKVRHVFTRAEWNAERRYSESWYAGVYINIEHANNRHTRYMHLDATYVNPGDPVKKGQLIGTIGVTGVERAKTHLHFETRINGTDKKGQAVNPHLWINFENENKATSSLAIPGPEVQQDVPASFETRIALIMSPVQALRIKLETESPGFHSEGKTEQELLAFADKFRRGVSSNLQAQAEIGALADAVANGTIFFQHAVTGKVAQLQAFQLSPQLLQAEGCVSPIPMAISVGFGTNITPLPLEGHRFPTIQYVGGQHTMGTLSFRLEDSTREFIRRLKMLIHAHEESALHFREFTRKRGVTIFNPLFDALNITEVLIEANSIDTIPGSPDGTFVTLNLMDNTRFEERAPLVMPVRDGLSDNQGIAVLDLLLRKGWLKIKAKLSTGTIAQYNFKKSKTAGMSLTYDDGTRFVPKDTSVEDLIEALKYRRADNSQTKLVSSKKLQRGETEYTYTGGFSIICTDTEDPLNNPNRTTSLKARVQIFREFLTLLKFETTSGFTQSQPLAEKAIRALIDAFSIKNEVITTGDFAVRGVFNPADDGNTDNTIDYGPDIHNPLNTEIYNPESELDYNDFREWFGKSNKFSGHHKVGLWLALFGGTNGKGLVNTPEFEMWSQKHAKKLVEVLGRAQETGKALDEDFAGLYNVLVGGFEFEAGHEAYPDLFLPPNPITGLCIDTNPDFFLANHSDINLCNTNALKIICGDQSNIMKVKASERAKFAYDNGHEGYLGLLGLNTSIEPAHLGPGNMYSGNESFNRGKFKTGFSKKNILTSAKHFFTESSDRASNPPVTAGALIDIPGQNIVTENNIAGRKTSPGYDRAKAMEITYKDSVYKEQTIGFYENGDDEGNQLKNMMKIRHEFKLDNYKAIFDQFTTNYTSDHYAVRRAFPTFKVFFIEEDGEDDAEQAEGRLGEFVNKLTSVRALDDFYSVNAIKSISIVHAKDMAASVCTIEILDLDGVLYNKKFDASDNPSGEFKDLSGSIANQGKVVHENRLQDDSNPFFSTMIKEGMKIVVKLGYMNDPDALETAFVGQIAHFEGTHVITLICQSYGTELIAQKFGNDPEENAAFYNARTEDLLHDLLDREEVRHFGRWRLSDIKLFGNLFGSEKMRPDGKISKIYTWRPSVIDDNLFIPDSSTYQTGWAWTWGDLEYVFWDTTIWDCFKEMELRHPGYIAYPVPYGTGADGRMTMFFGQPDMPYISRPASSKSEKEAELSDDINHTGTVGKKIQEIGREYFRGTSVPRSEWTEELRVARLNPENQFQTGLKILRGEIPPQDNWQGLTSDEMAELGAAVSDISKNIKKGLEVQKKGGGISTASFGDIAGSWYGTRLRPFRNYELVTSMHDIIANNIATDHRGTFNSIELHYSDNDIELGEFAEGDFEAFTVNADDNIKEHHIRRTIEAYPNCTTSDLAKRYAAQLLANSLQRTYQGNLLILGRPKLKPYDMIWLYDNYSDMAGPCEIQEVIHSFSQETGFISDIIPNMIVSVSNEPKLLTSDAMGMFFDMHCRDYAKGAMIGLGATAMVAGVFKAGASFNATLGANIQASLGGATQATAAGLQSGVALARASTIQIAGGSAGVVKGLATNGGTGDSQETDYGNVTTGVAGGLAIGVLTTIMPIAIPISGIVAGYLAYKYMKYNTTREPILVTPLIKDGKPYITGLEGMETDGLLCTSIGLSKANSKKWEYFFTGLDDATDLIKYGWANYWDGDN